MRKISAASFKKLKEKTAALLAKHRKSKDIFKAVKLEKKIQRILKTGEQMKHLLTDEPN